MDHLAIREQYVKNQHTSLHCFHYTNINDFNLITGYSHAENGFHFNGLMDKCNY